MNFEKEILNVPNATRNMSEEEFTRSLPEMANQLSKIDFHYYYDDKTLLKSWERLKGFSTTDNFTASQCRPGMELCEHFFPNFYDIKNNKGQKFADFWVPEKLEKILKWNRQSHSTPYLSELKRGVYFCYGLTKNTMYRPHLAKMICDYYKPKTVLDPCAGWGGRMLGVVASGANYIAFEPNTQTYNHLLEMADFLGVSDKITIYNDVAENMDNYDFEVDLVLTSPPYYDLEVYCDEDTQSITNYFTYEEWLKGWLAPVVVKSLGKLTKGGMSCWNVGPKMIDDVENIHRENGYVYDNVFGLHSSARQANQNLAKDKKTKDSTICYRKDS